MITKKTIQYKNITILTFLFAASFLISCGGDEEEPFIPLPSITSFTASSDDEITFNEDRTKLAVSSGTIVSWSFDISVPGGFGSFSVAGLRNSVLIQNAESDAADVEISSDGTSVQINNLMLVFEGNDDIEISFITTDNRNQSNLVTLTIEINTTPVRTFNDIKMESPVQDLPGTATDERISTTWFSANLGSTITSAAVVAGSAQSKDVDFGFYFANGSTFFSSPESFPANQYNLGSTGQNWSTLHITTFRTVAIEQSNFFQINTAFDIDEAYNSGEDTNSDGAFEGVTAGMAIGFQTDGDKDGGFIRGLMFIRSITPGNGSPDEIVFDVRIQ